MLCEHMKTEKLLSNYALRKIRIGVLGSHSALEIAHGAKQEDFETVVVCQKSREKTYAKYYRNLFDHVILLDKFADIIKDENIQQLRKLNTVFVPTRSSPFYVGYDNIEEKFTVPILGNSNMIQTEE